MQQQVSEQQIVQMAQQEEAIIDSQKSFLRKVISILRDSNRTIDSLNELMKNPEKMYINLGSGVLVEVEPKNTEKCKRAFAENGYLEEGIPETIKWLQKRKENSQNQIERIKQDLAKSETKLNELISVLKQIDAQKRKQQEFSISKK